MQNFAGVARGPANRKGFQGELRGLPARGAGLAQVPARVPVRRLPGRRHGSRQDGADAGALQDRKRDPKEQRPSLIVVPKSLMFNWEQEIQRFTPQSARTSSTPASSGPHCASDFVARRHHPDDLRHAAPRHHRPQGRRSSTTPCSTKPRRSRTPTRRSPRRAGCCKAEHRLALSGTPIENHLGDLWSIFEFLNPGMLGRSSVFQLSMPPTPRTPQSRQVLAAGLRPFVLRRTKKQVATELPEKFEQTIFCDMGTRQQQALQRAARPLPRLAAGPGQDAGAGQVEDARAGSAAAAAAGRLPPGAARSRDQTKSRSPSSTSSCPHLEELIEEGHKALVFSQFTSMLAIVKQHLDKTRHPLRLPRRQDPRPQAGRRAVPERSRRAGCS